ncbi:MAG: hypothetical protein JXN64_14905 [Spirochaetes bacterium]|nr:hypothetical protein [Spirochaetota bacterium]
MISRLIPIIVFFLILSSNAYSENQFKDIKIAGLKIYSEKFLIDTINFNALTRETNHFASVSGKITAFYHKNGYILVKIHLVKEDNDRIIIFVDEGQIGKIIFKKLDTIDTIKMKYEFELEKRIYNKYAIVKEIARVKKKYGFTDITYSLRPITEGDESFFQLNDKIIIPGLGTVRIPLFNEYTSRYNLEIEFIRKSGTTTATLSYGIKTSYSRGFIPNLEYTLPSCLYKRDLLIFESSIGIYYGFDLKFKNPPRWTFMEASSEYHFSPIKNYFTPMISASAYYSRSSRKDLGITNYNYLKLRSLFAPGITVLKNLHIYEGVGGESVLIFTPKTEKDSQYASKIDEHNETWAIFESRIKLDIRPWTLKKTKKQKFEAMYNYYTNKKYFHEVNIECDSIIEFKNLDLYIFYLKFAKLWNRPPFYHEYPVSDADFKGFMGKSYHTRNILKFSNEYKFSIYRDVYHLGLFTDLTRFEGSGYDLTGYQNGLVAGIAGHIIFLDQFEFNIFFGRDYLFSNGESQYNMYLNLRKKW